MAEGVRLKRGAGAGCTRPSTSTKVARAWLCGCRWASHGERTGTAQASVPSKIAVHSFACLGGEDRRVTLFPGRPIGFVVLLAPDELADRRSIPCPPATGRRTWTRARPRRRTCRRRSRTPRRRAHRYRAGWRPARRSTCRTRGTNGPSSSGTPRRRPWRRRPLGPHRNGKPPAAPTPCRRRAACPRRRSRPRDSRGGTGGEPARPNGHRAPPMAM